MRGDAEELVWGGEVEHGRSRPWASSSRARRVLAPLRVAALRIRHKPARTALVATGVALATATLVGVAGGTFVMRDRVLHKQLAAFPHERLSFRVDDFKLGFSSGPADATAASRALALVSSQPPVPTVALSALRFQSHLVVLTAVARPERWLRLQSGRVPGACRPARCEVLVIGSAQLPKQLTTRGLRVVPVGRASLVTPSVLGDFAKPSAATLLVSSDVRGLASEPALSSNFQTESWVVPLRPGDVRLWDVHRLLDREARAQSLLETANPNLRLTGPDEPLLEGLQLGRVGARRMLLVGGEIAALLLGFAVLAAVRLRRTLSAEWRRLEERGARRAQLWLLVTAETGLAAFVGAVVGGIAGVAAAAWAGERAGVGAHALLSHSVLTTGTVALVAGIWVVATIVLVLSVRPPGAARSGPVRIGDVVALGALAAAILAASRGGAGADALAGSRGSVTLLLLFPGLLTLAAAIIAARAFTPCLRLAERAVRRSRTSIRLAVLALARAQARTAVAIGFLVVSIGLALLAASYRATLQRGVSDEASYQVPLDLTVTEGARLVGPLDAASLERYRALASGVQAYPVLRRYGDVPSVGTQFASPVVLGLDPRAIAGVHGWRSDFGSPPPEALSRLLGAGGHVGLAGPSIPRGTTGFALGARRRGAEVSLSLALAERSGKIVNVDLRGPGSPGAGAGIRVPAQGRLIALTISLTRGAAAAIAHREAIHSVGGPSPQGSLELGPLYVLSPGHPPRVLTSWRGWIGRSGARRVVGKRATVRYALTEGETAVFRPREPTDGHPLLLVASPDVARSAAPGGRVTLEFGTQHVAGRIVSVASRFPGTADGGGSFVLADESHLQTMLDADEPGTGRPIEVWLSVPRHVLGRVQEELRRRPFTAVDVVSRRGLEHEFGADPLSRAVEIALGVGALVALALAVGGLWLTVVGDVEDEQGDLYDLEAQGVTPGELRSQLRLRAAILVLLGLAGGLLLGLILTREVVRLIQVSAVGEAPVPPLLRHVGWTSVGAGLVVLVLVGSALIEVTLRRAFREDAPRRSGDLE